MSETLISQNLNLNSKKSLEKGMGLMTLYIIRETRNLSIRIYKRVDIFMRDTTLSQDRKMMFINHMYNSRGDTQRTTSSIDHHNTLCGKVWVDHIEIYRG